jgi:hypothetical protein
MKIEGKDEGSIHRLDLEGQAKIKRLKSNMTRSGLKKKYLRLNNRLKSDIKRLTRIRMKFNKVKVKAEKYPVTRGSADTASSFYDTKKLIEKYHTSCSCANFKISSKDRKLSWPRTGSFSRKPKWLSVATKMRKASICGKKWDRFNFKAACEGKKKKNKVIVVW